MTSPSHCFAAAALLVVLCPGFAVAQSTDPEPSFSTAEAMRSRRRQETPVEGEEPAQRLEGPARSLEFAVSDDSFWVGLRTPVRFGGGHVEFGVLGDDDDLAATGRLVRYGRPFPGSAWSFGAGVGAYVALFDEPADRDAYALALVGTASLEPFPDVPLRFEFDLAFAPGVTTWGDGEDLFDLRLRAEFELSSFASVFLGYRRLEVDLGSDGDGELDGRFHFGVRLAF